LAFFFWLNVLLSFFGLRDSLIASIGAALNANLGIGSFSITLGGILAFLITVWASFLVSKFLRFPLEEDVYHHLRLAPGIPYAISTMLHYVILLIGFFVALGALGIDLTKVTILAGAFSVGIGDVIEVGGIVGEVQPHRHPGQRYSGRGRFRSHRSEWIAHLQSGDQLDLLGSTARGRTLGQRGRRRRSPTRG
jgi:hypothetical protein